jgi:hypothetical protein
VTRAVPIPPAVNTGREAVESWVRRTLKRDDIEFELDDEHDWIVVIFGPPDERGSCDVLGHIDTFTDHLVIEGP